ncbi:MalY/PatB family protein [Enterococcus olivae]
MEKEQFIKTYSVQRKKTDSIKWDALEERFGSNDLLPVWVADMEFATPETVRDALSERIQHGVFGYSLVTTDYFQAYQGWQERHEQSKFQEEWLSFSTGVVQSLYDLIDCFTEEGDAIIIQTPVYYPFSHAIRDKHRCLVTSDLILDDGRYVMDLKDFEQKIIDQQPKMFILCSPHNPVGRVWSEEELSAVLTICQKHQVLVLSDEIHSDIVLSDHQFCSSVSVAEGKFLDQLILVNSPSKTFNLASLLNSHVWIPDEDLRKTYQAWKKQYKQTENSLIGQLAAKVAYETADEWLDGLLQTIESNYLYAKKRLAEELPEVIVADLEGTYLMWLDLRSYVDKKQIKQVVQDEGKLAIDFGEWFSPRAKGFIRINLATTPEIIEQSINQLIGAIQQ